MPRKSLLELEPVNKKKRTTGPIVRDSFFQENNRLPDWCKKKNEETAVISRFLSLMMRQEGE